MADYSQFNSDSGAYNFSKGPKSLYYGQGDTDVFGVILNIPQTDDDDEWGGTNRIAQERMIDKIADLVVDVQDPVGGDGLNQKMEALVGTGGIIDLSVPRIDLDDITINGNTNKILIGSYMELTQSKLSLNSGAFVINSITDGYRMDIGQVQLNFVDGGNRNNEYVDILFRGSERFRFKYDSLSFPAGASLTGVDNLEITDTISVQDIALNGEMTGNDVNITFTGTSDITARDLNANRAVYVDDWLELGDRASAPDPSTGNIRIYWQNSAEILRYKKGDDTVRNIVTDLTKFTIDTQSILPRTNNTYDLGASSNKWQDVYATDVYATNIKDLASVTGTVAFDDIVTFDSRIETGAIRPRDSSNYNIGTYSERYYRIYGVRFNASEQVISPLYRISNSSNPGAASSTEANVWYRDAQKELRYTDDTGTVRNVITDILSRTINMETTDTYKIGSSDTDRLEELWSKRMFGSNITLDGYVKSDKLLLDMKTSQPGSPGANEALLFFEVDNSQWRYDYDGAPSITFIIADNYHDIIPKESGLTLGNNSNRYDYFYGNYVSLSEQAAPGTPNNKATLFYSTNDDMRYQVGNDTVYRLFDSGRDVIPDSTDDKILGDSANWWYKVWSRHLSIKTTSTSDEPPSGFINVYADSDGGGYLGVRRNGQNASRLFDSRSDMIPSIGNLDIGASGDRWGKIWCDDINVDQDIDARDLNLSRNFRAEGTIEVNLYMGFDITTQPANQGNQVRLYCRELGGINRLVAVANGQEYSIDWSIV